MPGEALVGVLCSGVILALVGAAESLRIPMFPGDPRPHRARLRDYRALHRRRGLSVGPAALLGAVAGVGLLVAGVTGWPSRPVPMMAAGAVAAASAAAAWDLVPQGRAAPDEPVRPRRGGRRLQQLLGSLGVTLAILVLLAGIDGARLVAPGVVWTAVVLVLHLLLRAVVGVTATAAHRWPLVGAMPVVVGGVLVVRAIPMWWELHVDAGQGNLLAVTVDLLIVAVMSGFGRSARTGAVNRP